MKEEYKTISFRLSDEVIRELKKRRHKTWNMTFKKLLKDKTI